MKCIASSKQWNWILTSETCFLRKNQKNFPRRRMTKNRRLTQRKYNSFFSYFFVAKNNLMNLLLNWFLVIQSHCRIMIADATNNFSANSCSFRSTIAEITELVGSLIKLFSFSKRKYFSSFPLRVATIKVDIEIHFKFKRSWQLLLCDVNPNSVCDCKNTKKKKD